MGLLTLGFDAGRFPPTPPACYRASWQLPGPDLHRLAMTSLQSALAEVFKRLLRMDGLRVLAAEFRQADSEGEELVIDVSLGGRRRLRCPRCGHRTWSVYDRSRRTWRHLDLVRVRCLLRAEVRRLDCPACGVVAEAVPFARPGARFSRAFEDTAAFLARAAPKTSHGRKGQAAAGRAASRSGRQAISSR